MEYPVFFTLTYGVNIWSIFPIDYLITGNQEITSLPTLLNNKKINKIGD